MRQKTASTELSQLQFFDAFYPVDLNKLNRQEYDQFLESTLFLKGKIDATIKGRMVANVNKQRGTIPKDDATSPTSALESVLLTTIIDAKEGQDMSIFDIPNTFVKT